MTNSINFIVERDKSYSNDQWDALTASIVPLIRSKAFRPVSVQAHVEGIASDLFDLELPTLRGSDSTRQLSIIATTAGRVDHKDITQAFLAIVDLIGIEPFTLRYWLDVNPVEDVEEYLAGYDFYNVGYY